MCLTSGVRTHPPEMDPRTHTATVRQIGAQLNVDVRALTRDVDLIRLVQLLSREVVKRIREQREHPHCEYVRRRQPRRDLRSERHHAWRNQFDAELRIAEDVDDDGDESQDAAGGNQAAGEQ